MQMFQRKPTPRGKSSISISTEMLLTGPALLSIGNTPLRPLCPLQNRYERHNERSPAGFEVRMTPESLAGSGMELYWSVRIDSIPTSTADLERELLSIDRDEKKLIKDIKDAAK